MSRLRLRMAISLDGYVAGPRQSKQDPMGVGGLQNHSWVFGTRAFQKMLGNAKNGEGEVGVSNDVVEAATAGVGATIMGRNMFGGGPGSWDNDPSWEGWWGKEPPFHHPVFVLTHHARAPLTLGETTFTFVTDGIESALEKAKKAAGSQDIIVGGGAATARAFLNAGLIDEMVLHQTSVLLHEGERLFHGVKDLGGMTLREVLPAPGVTHLRYGR